MSPGLKKPEEMHLDDIKRELIQRVLNNLLIPNANTLKKLSQPRRART